MHRWFLWLVPGLLAACQGSLPISADGGQIHGDGEVASEQCGNGLDDDGDGQVDEGCSCTDGETQACYGGSPAVAGKGICAMGQQSCSGTGEFGTWGPCNGWVPPEAEVPGNGKDDDCDGTVDGIATGTGCGALSRLSSNSAGGPTHGETLVADISDDGRHVVLITSTDELIPGSVTADAWALLVHDRQTGQPVQIATTHPNWFVDWWWGVGAAISGDGQRLAFYQANSDGSTWQLMVHDRSASTSKPIAKGSSYHPGWWGGLDLSTDGRYVLFNQLDEPSNTGQLELYDGNTGKATMIAKGVAWGVWHGAWGAGISGDGRYVAYDEADATQTNRLVQLYDHTSKKKKTLAKTGPGNLDVWWGHGTAISADGRYVAYSESKLIEPDKWTWRLVLHDTATDQKLEVATAETSTQWDYRWGFGVSLSGDGRYLLFHKPYDEQLSTPLHVFDRQTKSSAQVAKASVGPQGVCTNYGCGYRHAVISANGRCIAFSSNAKVLPDDEEGQHIQAYVTPNPLP